MSDSMGVWLSDSARLRFREEDIQAAGAHRTSNLVDRGIMVLGEVAGSNPARSVGSVV